MATDYDKELDSIREDLDDLHDNKVDVVKGKQLSTNDFTNEHLRKVNRIETEEYQQEIVSGVAKDLERTNDNHVRLADEFHRHLYGQDGVDAKFRKEIQDNLNYMSGLVKSANDRMNEIWQNWDEIVKEDQNHELRLQQVEGKTLNHDALIDSNTSEILNIQGEQVIQNNQIKEMQDKSVELETRVVDVEVSDADQNHRLDIAENRIGTFTDRMTALEDGYAQRDARMDGLDAQVSRYTERMLAIELNEKAQDERIKAEVEKNKRQDIDIACLYAEAKDRTITLDTEGTAVELQNSREGFVVTNSIEGNTMVNCNKDVDKELTLLTSTVDVSSDNGVTLTEGVVDGGKVDVYLEGNTLVNVSKTKDITALPLDEQLTYLYANTQYIVQFISDKAITTDINLGGTQLLAQNIVVGLNRISITTPTTLVDNKLVISGVGANISKVVVTDTNREFGYFEGMKSVGECEDLEVKSGNKNLFDISLLKPISDKTTTYGYYKFNPYRVNMTLSITDKDPSVDISELYIGFTGNGKDASDDYDWLINMGNPLSTKSITKNMAYISFYPNEQSTLDKLFARFNFQLEEGSTATDYIPHAHNTQTLTHEPLRAVENTKDRYLLIDGKWYIERNCGERVLNGTESWNNGSYGGLTGGDTMLFQIIYPLDKINNNTINIISNRIKGVDTNKNWATDIECISLNANGQVQLRIRIDKLLTPDAKGLKTWLQSNNIKCLYKLATPIYEPLEYNPFEVYSEVTHISTNSVIPCNVTVKNHGYNCILKPSTTYTVVSNQGVQNMTTPATLGDSLRFSGNGLLKDVMILEGTLSDNQIPGFFAGMGSSFEQHKITDEYDEHFGYYEVTAKVVDKNKINQPYAASVINYDGEKYIASDGDTREYIALKIQSRGKVFDSSTVKWTKYVAPNVVTSIGKYSVSFTKTSTDPYLRFSNSGETKEFSLYWDISHLTDGEYTFSFELLNLTVGALEFKNFQIERGEIETEYEPYKESVIKFYIKDPLRGIGDIKDKVFIQDDKVIVLRNCKEVTWNGNETWPVVSDTTNYGKVVFAGIDVDDCYKHNGKVVVKCDKLSSIPGSSYDYYQESIYGYKTDSYTRIYIHLQKYRLNTPDLDGLKAWLQANPLTVVYQLAEPTYEEAVYSGIRLSQNIWEKSTLFFDTNIPSSANISYSISTPVLDQVAEVSSITDDQDALIIDMATQLAVLNMTM